MEFGILEEMQYLKIWWDEARSMVITKKAIDPPLEDMIDETDFEMREQVEKFGIWKLKV